MQSHRIFPAALVALATCSAASNFPTATRPNGPTPLAIRGVGGGSQRGFLGDLLADPVFVQVVDSAGHPVDGQRRIRFSVVRGGGSVSDTSVLSADNGRASVAWRLGAAVGLQELRASLANVDSSAETRVFANGVSPDDADLVVIRGTTSGKVGILVRQDNFTWAYALTWPDTVLRLLPHAPANDGPAGTASWQEVTAFSVGHPPATALQRWTEGVDTVRLALRPPISVPFTVWVTHDFDSTAARARYDLANLDRFWRSHMTGLQVGTLRIEDVPELEGTLSQCTEEKRRFDSAAINVYYMSTQVDASRPAVTCDATTVLMGMNTIWSYSQEYQLLLTHEVGHALSLGHISDPNNSMFPYPWGPILTTGQIFRMHFHFWGALNSVLGIHPVGERNCNLPFSAHCPEQTFVAVW